MQSYWLMCAIVCPLVFLGTFIDAVAGGGGLVTLPAYLLAGLPAHMAAGTNKLVNCCGSVAASCRYFRSGNVQLRIALLSALGSIIGGALGSRLALFIPEASLKLMMLLILPVVGVYLILKRDFGMTQHPRRLTLPMESATAMAIGFVIGCYDGLIGPGTGTLLIVAFSGILGLELLVSGGCAKVSNTASNLGSVIVFLLNGKVLIPLALPAILFSVLGSILGSRYAIRGGSKRIRKVLVFVLILLFGTLFREYFSQAA